LANQNNSGPSDHDLEQAMPEQKGSRNVSVGVFVILGLVTFITLLFLLTDAAAFRGRYKITTAVEDVSGLRNGDPVQMRGVNIGRVHRSSMEPGADSVVVTLEIEGEWEIPVDSRVELLSGGVLAGGRIVEIRPGTMNEFVNGGGHIPGEVVRGMLEDSDALAERGRELLDRLNGLLSDSTVRNVEGTLGEMQILMTEMADLAEERGDDLGSLIDELRSTARNLGDATGPEFQENLQGTLASADSMMISMNSASTRLNRASASLEVVLARMERGEGTLGQLSVNDSLYHSLNAAAASLQTLLKDLQANPGRYINVSIF